MNSLMTIAVHGRQIGHLVDLVQGFGGVHMVHVQVGRQNPLVTYPTHVLVAVVRISSVQQVLEVVPRMGLPKSNDS